MEQQPGTVRHRAVGGATGEPAKIRAVGPAAAAAEELSGSSFKVEYVVKFLYDDADPKRTVEAFFELIKALEGAGFDCQVRHGADGYMLVFVRVAADERLSSEIYQYRVRDFIYGIRRWPPSNVIAEALEEEPATEAERLRVIFKMITRPRAENGAGITPGKGSWKLVDSVFPLHNHASNSLFLTEASKTYFLDQRGINYIRNQFGSKVAFYFVFAQKYFSFLIVPTVLGIGATVLLANFSPWYALLNGLWCIVFTEYWRYYEIDLARKWGTRGVSNINAKRAGFDTSSPSGPGVRAAHGEEEERPFSPYRRILRQTLQIPFLLVSSFLLSTVIAVCFAIEIFVTEVYSGPFKSVLAFLPTVLVGVGLFVVKTITSVVAASLTEFENYETEEAHEAALTTKLLVVDFVTSYLPLCLTAFVYLPFADSIVPYLDVFSVVPIPDILTAAAGAELELEPFSVLQSKFRVNPSRLRDQVFYFTVTARIIHFGVGFVLPYLQRRGLGKLRAYLNKHRQRSTGAVQRPVYADPPQDSDFLDLVRAEAELPTYDPGEDFREMVVQFGYLSLFSVVFPLTPVSFLVTNWVELRADAAKICHEMKRPIPWQSENIGPWLEALGLIGWMGSITSAALVIMFSGVDFNGGGGVGEGSSLIGVSSWVIAAGVLFAEHVHLLVRTIVRSVISQMDFPGKRRELREKHLAEVRFRSQMTSMAGLDSDEGGMAALQTPLLSPSSTFADMQALPEERDQLLDEIAVGGKRKGVPHVLVPLKGPQLLPESDDDRMLANASVDRADLVRPAIATGYTILCMHFSPASPGSPPGKGSNHEKEL